MTTTNGNGSPFVLASSPGMHAMARSIQERLGRIGPPLPHYEVEYTTFKNGEVLPRIPNTIRGQHVFFLHPMQDPSPNEAVMRMLLACDAMKRASVAGITLVLPYMSYLRQDRKDKPRVPISARVIADLIESNPKNERVITIDMHAEQEQGFFSIPVDNLTTRPLFAAHARKSFQDRVGDLVVVAPDFGSAVRNEKFAQDIGPDVPVAIFQKRRPAPNVSEVATIITERSLDGTVAILYDDIVDTGGTILGALRKLKEEGVRETYMYVSHAILSAGAEERFAASGFRVVSTDSVPRSAQFLEANPWLSILSIDALLADAIHEASLVGGSVSKLST